MYKKNLFSILIFLFVLVFAVAGASKISNNTAHFLSVLRENDSIMLKNRFYIRKVNNTSYVNAFLQMKNGADTTALKELGVEIHPMITGIITARIPVQSLDSVSKLDAVKYVQLASKVNKRMNIARTAALVDQVQAGTGLAGPYTGKDVVVGIVDEGFQYDHINFYTSDGTQTRVKRVWDQNKTGTPPSGYSYGAEYSTQATIFAAKNDFTTETHATHVTGIAAGSDKNNGNTYYGNAPDADLVLVSYNQSDNSTDNVSLSDGIKYIYNYATSVNKPCVVNLSLGSHYGPHDGTSLFDQVCDGLQGAGRLIVGSAGNEGADNLHISKTFTNTTDTLKSFLSFSSSSSLSGQADIWGTAGKTFSVNVVVYNKNTGKIAYSTSFQDAASTSGKKYTLTAAATGVAGAIYVYTERSALNNKPNALVYASLTSISSGYYVGIQITTKDGSTVHAWTDAVYSFFSGNSVSGWTTGNSENSMGEVGGSGKKIITVGAYTTKTNVSNMSGTSYGAGQTLNTLCTFSSKGPTIDGRMKPDITAPGSLLVSSYSSAVLTGSTSSNYFVKKNTVNSVDYYYGFMQGTSMASPFVTGVLATWLGVKNTLSPEEVRTIFQNTAIRDDYTGAISTSGSNSWGYGKIDAWNGIKACLQLTSQDEQTVRADFQLYPNPVIDQCRILFTKQDTNVRLSVYSVDGQQVMQKSIGNVEIAQEVDLNFSALSTGVYLIRISGQHQYVTQRIIRQ